MRRHLVMAAAILFCSIPKSNAQEPEQADQRAEQLYKEFESTADLFEVSVKGDTEKFTRQAEPLMRFSVSGTTFGSVFVWLNKNDRLAMIGTIGSIPIRNADWEFIEFHLLIPKQIEQVEVAGRPNKTWNPNVEDLKLRPIPGAPPVAAQERSRLVQMRSLARKFSGKMNYEGNLNNLRLLPQPLYRQKKSTPDLDSAIFALVFDRGTDPEILLRIETKEIDGKQVWHYQPIRFTWRELSLNLGDTEVWKVDEFVEREAAMQTTPYVTGLTRIIP